MKFTPAVKRGLAIIALACTLIAFGYYAYTHPAILRQLGQTDPKLLALLVAGYGIFTLTLVGIQSATLRMVRVRMPSTENLLLTSYSSIANFFGPLQSGPGVRLAYLKTRYHISVKAYVLATFIYYGFFACISGLMLTAGALAWWQTLGILALIGGGSYVVIRRKRAQVGTGHGFTVPTIAWLGLATLAQLLIVSLLYFVELRSIDPHVSYAQAITYTGAANFALFVSVTPGAIGFRESFLLFTTQLHHIPHDQVLAASLIDRSANLLFLGILFLVTISVHAKQRFTPKTPAADER